MYDIKQMEQIASQFYQEIEAYGYRMDVTQPYIARLKTRIIVTNKVDYHLRPDAPQDVAVYYLAPAANDVELMFWRNAVLEVWLHAIVMGSVKSSIAGMRRATLRLKSPLDFKVLSLSEAESDYALSQGYNLIRSLPGYGPVLWGDTIWRNGKPVSASFKDIETAYKHTATPLALLE